MSKWSQNRGIKTQFRFEVFCFLNQNNRISEKGRYAFYIDNYINNGKEGRDKVFLYDR